MPTEMDTARLSDAGLDWPGRRKLAARVAAELADGNTSPEMLRLVDQLADDPKWEVRKDIADVLVLLPEGEFVRLAAKLSGDLNGFVRSAAEQAIDRRRKVAKRAERTSDGLAQLRWKWETLERRHGKRVATRARRLADEQLAHLLGPTVHEMRNVLTPLKAGVVSIVRRLDGLAADPAKANRALARIGFLERLLDDMRRFSQPLPTKRRPERLRSVVREAVTMAQEALVASDRDPGRVTVDVQVPNDLGVEMARKHILVATANVVKNAIEAYATGPKRFQQGKVSIVAHVNGNGQVEIVTEDHGMGMTAEDLDEVRQFAPGKTTKRNLGTGFGLPIAKRNVLAHGGELSIESQEGEGTLVTITLPLHQERIDER